MSDVSIFESLWKQSELHEKLNELCEQLKIRDNIQVISNLIDNAFNFTKKGAITITKEKRIEDSSVIVSIKDTGTGIDSEILPRLFTKFTTGSDKGTGLGLYICKTIIEAHGGKIWGENNDDRGATFSFSLPAEI